MQCKRGDGKASSQRKAEAQDDTIRSGVSQKRETGQAKTGNAGRRQYHVGREGEARAVNRDRRAACVHSESTETASATAEFGACRQAGEWWSARIEEVQECAVSKVDGAACGDAKAEWEPDWTAYRACCAAGRPRSRSAARTRTSHCTQGRHRQTMGEHRARAKGDKCTAADEPSG